MAKTPLRRGGGGQHAFTTELQVRCAVAKVRDAYPTLDDAEQSDDWKKLRPFVARWALTGWAAPKKGDDGWPARIARIYLMSPEKLPPLAPGSGS